MQHPLPAILALTGACLALGACDHMMAGDRAPATAAQAEAANAGNINSNGSAQPGGAGPAPDGSKGPPATSGSVGAPTPH